MRRPARLPRKVTPLGLVVAVIVVALALWQQRQSSQPVPAHPAGHGPQASPRRAAQPPATDAPACARVIKEAIENRRSDVMVECSGVIIKVLEDDNEGSRHQRLLVRLENDAVIKVSHNIDLAPRVPVSQGERIEFAGQFDWNEQGGAVHWTHHDPRGRRAGGWIRHRGKTYE